jgi:formyl-CoA transferase
VKAAPALGEHTDEVLKEIGYNADEIKALRDKHIVCK